MGYWSLSHRHCMVSGFSHSQRDVDLPGDPQALGLCPRLRILDGSDADVHSPTVLRSRKLLVHGLHKSTSWNGIPNTGSLAALPK